ncbi:hypothetical protein ABT299_44995 [Spirillospora sp. NPDC000708]
MYGDLPPSAYSRIPPEAPTHPEPGHVPYRQPTRRRWLVPAVAGLLAAFAVAAVMQLADDGGHSGADAATRTSTRPSPTSARTRTPAPAAPLPSTPAPASPTPTSASPTPRSKPHHHHSRTHHHGAAAPAPAPRPRQARPHAHHPRPRPHHHHARPRHRRPAGWVRTECRRRYHDAAHIAACQAALGGMFR